MDKSGANIKIKDTKGNVAHSMAQLFNEISADILGDVTQCLKDAEETTAAWAALKINENACAYGWKRYGSGWTYTREGKRAIRFVVHNKKYYRLTHLLEKGHRIIRHDGTDTGKRTDAKPHIAPVSEQVPDKVNENFDKNITEFFL